MENYNTETAMEKNGSIVKALADFPNSVVKTKKGSQPPAMAAKETNLPAGVQREAGDHLNSFMLCTLVNKTAKRIKMSAERQGASLAMTSVLRKVLGAYRHAAKDKDGPLSTSNPDINQLRALNKEIFLSLMKQGK